MGNIHTVGPNEALIVSGKSTKQFKNNFYPASFTRLESLLKFAHLVEI